MLFYDILIYLIIKNSVHYTYIILLQCDISKNIKITNKTFLCSGLALMKSKRSHTNEIITPPIDHT